jgi:hypothetical protein
MATRTKKDYQNRFILMFTPDEIVHMADFLIGAQTKFEKHSPRYDRALLISEELEETLVELGIED